MSKITAKDAIRELWYRGNLSYKLHGVQKQMLDSYLKQDSEVTVIACSRRLGKSYFLTILAIEQCLKAPNSIVKFVCPKKNQIRVIIQPIMNEIITDCPAELKPEFKYNDYMYVFPNGSQIHMSGTDNGHHENLRGSKSDLWIVDEAGFCDELKYIVNTILAPTADTTGGRGIIASTPSKTADHEFITDFFLPYEQDGNLIKYTIHDNPQLDKEQIQKIIARYPLKEKDPEFQREYLCKVVSGSDMSVIPEFTEELQAKIVRDHKKPPFFDSYVSMDIGGKDLTALLFAYYDFKLGVTVIEDELVFHKQTDNIAANQRIDKLAEAINKKEASLWTSSLTGEFKPPYIRISDNNNIILLNDLSYQYGVHFLPTRKDNREAALNTMRVKLAEEKIIIHPRCKNLIFHLHNSTWAPNKKDFSRSKNNGHWDFVPALMYLIRNIQETKNPYPAGYGINQENWFQSRGEDKPLTKSQESWKNLFKTRSSLK